LGYLIKGCLALCAGEGQPDWSRVAGHVEEVSRHWQAQAQPQPGSATASGGGWIVVCTPSTEVAARRWRADFNENAKSPLGIWVFPEAAHNALMVVSEESRCPRPHFFVLESVADAASPPWKAFLDLLRERGATLQMVRHPHPDPWVETLGLAHAGDWQSLLMAQALGVPAGSLSLLNAFKARLSRGQAP